MFITSFRLNLKNKQFIVDTAQRVQYNIIAL